jgi:GTP-binding protein
MKARVLDTGFWGMSNAAGFYDKPEIVGLTKLDATPEDYAADLAIALQEAGAGQVLALSSVTGSGVTTMLRQLINVIETSRAKEAEPEEAVPWSP